MRYEDLSKRQSAAFYEGEGDAWYQRNKDKDLNKWVVEALTHIDCNPQTIVEVGCSDGRYLNKMHDRYLCRCIGYDPSSVAIREGKARYHKLDLRLGTVRAFHGLPTDILVFGFCLYLVDREDIFPLVADADWCLKEGGYLVIHDFYPSIPIKIPYKHKEGLFSYKMRYPDLWLANPAYQCISNTGTGDGAAITILKKGTWDRWS